MLGTIFGILGFSGHRFAGAKRRPISLHCGSPCHSRTTQLSAGDSSSEGRRAAMRMFVGFRWCAWMPGAQRFAIKGGKCGRCASRVATEFLSATARTRVGSLRGQQADPSEHPAGHHRAPGVVARLVLHGAVLRFRVHRDRLATAASDILSVGARFQPAL